MLNSLCFTVRFLQPLSHGRGDGGEPEWPPSPLRFYQALVGASAARWNERQRLDHAVPALNWLEAQPSPAMIAANGIASDVRCQFYVPDNTADLLVPAWTRGEVDKQPKRTEKVVRPTHVSGEAVHFLYSLSPDGCPHEEVLKAAARSVTHLGWGIDMVAADAKVITQEEADKLPGHRWRVVSAGGLPLRVPKAGTLTDLLRKHDEFLNRVSANGFKPVAPLQCFDVVGYHSPTVPWAASAAPRPIAAFEIHRTIDDQEGKPGKSRFRPFHHVRKVATVAGMIRHAAASAARRMGQSEEWVNCHILGHEEGKQTPSRTDKRLMFLPVPSVTPVGVSGIRRVIVVGWPDCQELATLRRLLNGHELMDEGKAQAVAMLSHIPSSDKGVMRFTTSGRSWSTVTPVILPGHDDPDRLRRKLRQRGNTAGEQRHLLERLDTRILSLLWKAFQQAGMTKDALAGAELEYRPVGWFQGLNLAKTYELPPLKYPRYHVRVRFAHPVKGPLAIGAGRYRGFGLFATDQ